MADSADSSQLVALLVLSTILTAIAFIIVLLRLLVRCIILYKPGMDDGMMFGAMLFTIAYLATIYVSKTYGGLGRSMLTLSSEEMSTFLKVTFAIELIYYTIIFCVKSSIIFMYQRFAIWDTFKRLCIGTNIVLTAFYIACIGGTIGQCTPVEKAWDITRLLPGSCINTTAFFYFTSGFSIIADLWIILLPLPTLRALKISPHTRYILYAIFGAGLFATAMSIVRLYSIHIFTLATDPFKDGVLVNLWSMVEVTVAIVCASVPALKPLATPRKLLDERRKRSGYASHVPKPFSRSSKMDRLSSASQSHIARPMTPNRTDSPRSFPPDDNSGFSIPLHTL
ncbi:hypothetical protein F4802DRAFT_617966 [Xylaria palmicola]|nr:hypothetical protein F4802DRAFT_617966 [Xylaria palmicola]